MFNLRVIQNTFLKLDSQQASDLLEDQRYYLEAGTEFPVGSFQEFDDIHFQVAFGKDQSGNQISFPGPNGGLKNTWLIFEGHCVILNSDGSLALQFGTKIPLKLQDFLDHDLKVGFDVVAENKVLAVQVQDLLISLKLLSSTADGNFGPVSANALESFQKITKLQERGFLGRETAKKLLEAKLEDVQTPLNLGNDFASRIIKYMQAKKYRIATGAGEYNIVYVEGANEDGTPNSDTPNHFNDRRIVITFESGSPKIVGNWEGTTEPGSRYTNNPFSAKGAARIQFGQYKSWEVGIHALDSEGRRKPGAHEALIQTKGTVTVHRDLNKDFMRTHDSLETGYFGINQHHGYDFPSNDIKTASAGCLVGRTKAGHEEFMRLIKQDRRYLSNRGYAFEATIIPGDDLHRSFPPQ